MSLSLKSFLYFQGCDKIVRKIEGRDIHIQGTNEIVRKNRGIRKIEVQLLSFEKDTIKTRV